MGKVSAIEWTDATWNPWRGCTKVSPGCRICYAERIEGRYGRDFSTVRRAAERTFLAPLRWKEPRAIFTASMSDFFHEAADGWREEAWDVVRQTPRHTYQVLTKRPERIAECLPADWGESWPNVWLGASVELQPFLAGRVEALRRVRARVRFLSLEPLLGPLDLRDALPFVDWVIAGGESGPPRTARPPAGAWLLSIRDQCEASAVPFFFKQWGGSAKVDGVWGGRLLDGRTYDGTPDGGKEG